MRSYDLAVKMNEVDMLNDKHTPLQSNTVENKKLHEELRILPQGLACEGQKHKKFLCL